MNNIQTIAIEILEILHKIESRETKLDILENHRRLINSICTIVVESDLSNYPSNFTDEYIQAFREAYNQLDAINNKMSRVGFNPKTIDHELSVLNYFYKNTVSLTQQIFLTNSSIYIAANQVKTINGIVNEAQSTLEQINSSKIEIDTTKKELETLLSVNQTKAAEIAIAKFGSTFEGLANSHKKAAKRWFTGIVLLLITIVLTAIILLVFEPESKLNTTHIATIISTRVLVFGSLTVALSMSIRNYKAEKHNQLVNTHRQNALNTFDTFIKSAVDQDAQTKNSVLLEATRTIFSNQPTAYSNTDSDSDSPSRIIEIVKNITTQKSAG